MGALEAEAMLIGNWDNFEDLESKLSLPELNAVLKASRDKEHRQNKFMAALKGIDLDKHGEEDSETRFNEVQQRAQAKLAAMKTGRSAEHIEQEMAHADFGFSLEIEE